MENIINTISYVLITIILGILSNIISSKVKEWLSLQKVKNIQKRINFLDSLINQKDLLVSQPLFAIVYRQISKRLIGLELLILAFLLLTLTQYLSQDNIIIVIMQIVLLSLAFLFIVYYFINLRPKEMIDFYEITYDGEKYQKWREETLQEIERLKNLVKSKGVDSNSL